MLNTSVSRRTFMKISAMTAASMALDWNRISAHAASMGPPEQYPTVIIGAGLGGAGLRGVPGKAGYSGYPCRAAQHPRWLCNFF